MFQIAVNKINRNHEKVHPKARNKEPLFVLSHNAPIIK